ncbi:MAG: MerR family transcriptional regulator [Pseudomonadota bacterium]
MTERKIGTPSEYTIGAVAKLTGLSTQLIRAWESRYGAVVAARSANGRRIYGTADLEKLGLLKVLTERGIAISTIANLDIDALRERLGEADSVALKPLDGDVRVAALGAFVCDLLRREVLDTNPIELVACGVDEAAFLADSRNSAPDVLIVEVPSLVPATVSQLEALREATGAGETIVAYGFARSEDKRQLADRSFRLQRTPLMADELAVSILAAAVKLRAGDHYAAPPEIQVPVERSTGPIPARRYSAEQLVRLAAISSAVDCECPNHMAEVVQTLSSFERYSAECENRNEEDAQLHAYLHRTTAQARALMEEALAHLVEVEGLSL